MGQPEISYHCWNINCHTTLENWQSIENFKDPAVLILSINPTYTNAYVHQKTHTRMFVGQRDEGSVMWDE